jgi:hypothetical protein
MVYFFNAGLRPAGAREQYKDLYIVTFIQLYVLHDIGK